MLIEEQFPIWHQRSFLGTMFFLKGTSLEDLKRTDMWAYGMLLFIVVNLCLHYPYEIDVKQEGEGDAKEKIQRLLKIPNTNKSVRHNS